MADIQIRIQCLMMAINSPYETQEECTTLEILGRATGFYNFVTDFYPEDEFCGCEDCEPSFNF